MNGNSNATSNKIDLTNVKPAIPVNRRCFGPRDNGDGSFSLLSGATYVRGKNGQLVRVNHPATKKERRWEMEQRRYTPKAVPETKSEQAIRTSRLVCASSVGSGQAVLSGDSEKPVA